MPSKNLTPQPENRNAEPADEGWNPYFVAFARANGLSPEVQHERGKAIHFIIWMQRRWREYETFAQSKVGQEHPGFATWLVQRAEDLRGTR